MQCYLENVYLLGMSLACPVIARVQSSCSDREVSVRVPRPQRSGQVELAFYVLQPDSGHRSLADTSVLQDVQGLKRLAPSQRRVEVNYGPDPLRTQRARRYCHRLRERHANQANFKIPKEATDRTGIFLTANALARKHDVGCIDIVENRFIGLESRDCETLGLTILRNAHIDLEGLTLDCEVRATNSLWSTIPNSCTMAS
jgi:hypothetical protein